MNQKINIQEGASCAVSRGRNILEDLPIKGVFITEIWGRRKSGLLYFKERLLIRNTITTLAKNAMFEAMFNAGTQVPMANWAIGLVNTTGWVAFNAGDTMGSHGWTEFIGYSQTVRPAWGQGTATAGAITNASPATFDITGPVTVKGLFVASDNAKNGITGLLWSAAAYTSPPTVDNGDQIRSVYSLSM